MKLIRPNLKDTMPLVLFFFIFVFFSIASQGRMLTPYNLMTVFKQSIVTIIAGTGAIFVVAQGSIDLSVGVSLALAGIVGAAAAQLTGIDVLIVPVALMVGLGVGLLNGFIVSRFKVPSFMVTIAMLIGLRGLVNYIQTLVATQPFPSSLAFFDSNGAKILSFLIILVFMSYLFEYTKLGKYSKAIGENETAAKFTGIPVTKMKVTAFALSGVMAGAASIFLMAALGGTSTTMGMFFEMQVAMAVYLGGVLVTGGASARVYKLLLGSFTISVIGNGLALTGRSSSEMSESVQGILLIVILFISTYMNRKPKKN